MPLVGSASPWIVILPLMGVMVWLGCRPPSAAEDPGGSASAVAARDRDDDTAADEGPSRPRYWDLEDEEPVLDRPRAVGPPVGNEGLLPSLAPLVERLTPTVVGVTTRTRRAPPGSPLPPGIPSPPVPRREREEVGIGSGVIIDPEGLVLTNHHVIAGADRVEVRLADERRFDAEVVGADPETDIALLRLRDSEGNLPAATLGRSDYLRVGDYVIAIGNPFGLSLTVTAGIVSAMARVIGTSPFDDFLQTDAAINPGNSGGPLFDLEGRVVGINTAIVAPGEGIGFAVPIDLVRALLPQLVARGRVIRGYLGVVIRDLGPQAAEEAFVDQGAIIVTIERGGPADRAGLGGGDVIVAVDGEPVEGAASLSRLVARLSPGQRATLTIVRDGEERDVTVRAGERPPRREIHESVQ